MSKKLGPPKKTPSAPTPALTPVAEKHNDCTDIRAVLKDSKLVVLQEGDYVNIKTKNYPAMRMKAIDFLIHMALNHCKLEINMNHLNTMDVVIKVKS